MSSSEDVQKSYQPKRITRTSASTRQRNTRFSESESDAFNFSRIDDEEETPLNLKFKTGKKSIRKYAADDSSFAYSQIGLQRSCSDSGSVATMEPKPNEQSSDPLVIRDCTQLQQRLELMQHRCIARNLCTAGLGAFEVNSDDFPFGILNPNARMVTGEPMLIAVILYIKDPDIQARYVSILISENADVNCKDAVEKTALMHATEMGYEKSVKCLLQDDKIDLFLRDNEGSTALMYAAALGSPKILKLHFKALRKFDKCTTQQKRSSIDNPSQNIDRSISGGTVDIEKYADPLEMENARGYTARSIALKHGNLECANLLNEERLRRLKEINKKSVQKIDTSPSLLRRSAKRARQKQISHSSSFDSLYFDSDDRFDDQLIKSRATSRRTTTKTKHEMPTISQLKIDGEQDKAKPTTTRFRSSPDLINSRSRSRCSWDAADEEIGDLFSIDEAPVTAKRRQTLHGNSRINADQVKPRKYSMYAMSSTKTNESISTPRRKFTDKLMYFLLRRPKYLDVGSDKKSPQSPSFEKLISRSREDAVAEKIQKRSISTSTGFSKTSFDEATEKTKLIFEKKKSSTSNAPQIDQRLKNWQSNKAGSALVLDETKLKVSNSGANFKRRSVDFSFLSGFRNQNPSQDKSAKAVSAMVQTTITPLFSQAPAKSDFENAPNKASSMLPRLDSNELVQKSNDSVEKSVTEKNDR